MYGIPHLAKTTGTPEQLAAKLYCSRRTIYNLMQALRHFEAEIAYCQERCCYFYVRPPAVRFDQLLGPNGPRDTED